MELHDKKFEYVEHKDRVPDSQVPNIQDKVIALKKIKNKGIIRNKVWIITAIILLLVSVVTGGSYYFFYQYLPSQNNQQSGNLSLLFPTSTLTPTPTPTPEPIFYPNPITGELIPEADYLSMKDRPYLAVMIQNNTASRPEYGLNEADIVYETLVEGRITRFMGVFWSKEASKVQSLRSSRKYFVDLLGDYPNAVYMHIGYASGDPKIDALQAMNTYGIRRVGDLRDTNTGELAYSRDHECEKVKAREHCAYSTTQRLWNIASQKGWTNDSSKDVSWQFNDLEKINTTSGTPLTDFTVDFKPSGGKTTYYDKNYSVRWKYDPVTNKYLRYNFNGTPYVDGNGIQVSTTTLIYQKVVSYPFGDYKGHQYQEVIGSGTGYVMMAGKVFNVKWSKPNFKTKTQFTDAATGQPFVFQRGKIWNMILPKTYDYTNNIK